MRNLSPVSYEESAGAANNVGWKCMVRLKVSYCGFAPAAFRDSPGSRGENRSTGQNFSQEDVPEFRR